MADNRYFLIETPDDPELVGKLAILTVSYNGTYVELKPVDGRYLMKKERAHG